MTLLKKLLAMLLALSLALSFVACNKDPDDNTDPVTPDNTDVLPDDGEDVNYTVTVVNPFGKPLSGVTVLVHLDGGSDYNVCTVPVETDAYGKAVFTLKSGCSYSVGLAGYPEVYTAKSGQTSADRYALDATDTLITLGDGGSYLDSYRLGSYVPNFTFSDVHGNSYELYDVLAEKKAVVFNFWFIGCDPCLAEFPSMNKAYNTYSDSIELFAINNYANDVNNTPSAIIKFGEQRYLDMPLVSTNRNSEFAIARFLKNPEYPTTVVIDRYGMIAFMHVGTITSANTWEVLFAYFTASDYTSRVLGGISQIS